MKVKVTLRGSVVRIPVTNDGARVPKQRLDELFLPFKRACCSKPRTGLGLAIVKKYVTAFGGEV